MITELDAALKFRQCYSLGRCRGRSVGALDRQSRRLIQKEWPRFAVFSRILPVPHQVG